MGKTSQKVKSKQKTILPEFQQESVDRLFNMLGEWQGFEPYQGARFTPPTENELRGREMALQSAGDAQGISRLLSDYIGTYLDPNLAANPGSAPGVGAMQDAIATRGGQFLNEQILPTLDANAVAGGAFGGSRNKVGRALAGSRVAQNVGEAQAGLDMDAWKTLLDMSKFAATAAPGAVGLSAVPGQIYNQVGAQERTDQESQRAAQEMAFREGQGAPAQTLEFIKGITGGAGQYGGTVKGQQTTSAPPVTANQLLGLGLAGAGMFMGGPAAAGGLGSSGLGAAALAPMTGSSFLNTAVPGLSGVNQQLMQLQLLQAMMGGT